MTADENRLDVDQPEDLLVIVERLRRERDERIAEIWERMPELEVEPHPGLKRLVDTNDEFREHLMARIERVIASAPF